MGAATTPEANNIRKQCINISVNNLHHIAIYISLLT